MKASIFKSNYYKKSIVALSLSSVLAITSSAVMAAEEETQQVEEEVERIAVTGSRLTRASFDAPSPTVIVSAADIKLSGAGNLNDILSTMPQFGDGFDSTSGNYSFGNSGINAVNLRNLGANRTLVLINGKRPTPIADDSQMLYADIGMIPSELVERIEILTGGASAVYGSDAVAGVVNFIIKKDYEGTSVRAQVGDTQHGGGANQSITVINGFSFNDERGHMTMSVDYFKDSAIMAKDRPGSQNSMRAVSNPANTGPDDGIPDNIKMSGLTYPAFGTDTNMFGYWNGADGGTDWYQYENGTATLRTPATAQAEGWIATDGSGFDPNDYGSIEDPYDRLNAYVNLNYEFDSVTLSVDVMYSKTQATSSIDPAFVGDWESWYTLSQFDDNGITVPDALRAVMSPEDEWFSLPNTFYEAGPRSQKSDREYVSASLTLSGSFENDWTWDAYATSGTTKAELLVKNSLRTDRLDIDTYLLAGDCVDAGNCPEYNPFERPSQAVTDYILTDHLSTTDVVNHAFSANLGGDLFELPAGAVQMSTGVEVRYESLKFEPSEVWSTGKLSSDMSGMDASRTIQEVYAEFLVPVLSDVAFVKQLDIEAAYRKANYSTESASFDSAKLGLNWAINDSIRLRTTYSTAVRAPQLTEMFAGANSGFTDMTDPCDQYQIDAGPADGRRKDNCAALGITEEGWSSNVSGAKGKTASGGNEDLKEEEAETLTIGLVLTPSFIDNLTISFDYYDIKLEDMIVSQGASTILSNCTDLEAGSIDNTFCDKVQRDANGDINVVNTVSFNADAARRRGVDIASVYSYENWSFSLNASRQLETSYTEFNDVEGTSVTDDPLGELGNPKWQANLITTYNLDDLSVSWTAKFKQGGKRWLDISDEVYDDQSVDDSLIHDLNISYDISEAANVYLGVNNVTDEDGLDHWLTNWGTRIGWGIVGRSYYAGMTYQF
ncbi:TonB-dependent receptor [Shewanella abyssi]|uniref:TonB-dependent receptor domain-containing protein n=1 Tax=Shewanella abyssi TaxID=311789 RepID=UPI00201040A8|nr:TonB-dependent receptor [Shewanella abyssi]MCL1052226.1 TonB-dependent receptor [Shewanella abyssi]